MTSKNWSTAAKCRPMIQLMIFQAFLGPYVMLRLYSSCSATTSPTNTHTGTEAAATTGKREIRRGVCCRVVAWSYRTSYYYCVYIVQLVLFNSQVTYQSIMKEVSAYSPKSREFRKKNQFDLRPLSECVFRDAGKRQGTTVSDGLRRSSLSVVKRALSAHTVVKHALSAHTRHVSPVYHLLIYSLLIYLQIYLSILFLYFYL
jgi:hypothetical protein